MTVQAEPWRGPPALPPSTDASVAVFADGLYGPLPPAPDRLSLTRDPLPGEAATRLSLTLECGAGRLTVDAALWLPPADRGPTPVVCALDFLGPAGILTGTGFPLDPDAVVHVRPEHGITDGRLVPALRGASAMRWPIPAFRDAGVALLVSCYGSWVPDDPDLWTSTGLAPLLWPDGSPACGAISLWAWALLRLVDAAATLPQIDAAHIALAGHSRLGKAALWAAAQDPRIGAVFANQSGCAGAAPARHTVGETLHQLHDRFPHWLSSRFRPGAPDTLPFDQNQLLALIAPRAVYLSSAREDLWADPLGSYAALVAASGEIGWPDPVSHWRMGGTEQRSFFAHHLRAGGHDLTAADWQGFLAFLSAIGWPVTAASARNP